MEDLKKTQAIYPYLEKPIEIYERPCGHKIIFAYKSGSLINISSWVKTGAVNENDHNNGVSHFLEHLMFKGTSKHKAGYFDKTLESKGGIVNAATWKDYTYYYVTIPKGLDGKNFDITLELHADMMLDPINPDNERGLPFDINDTNITTKRERHVVIEEIKMRKDKPWTRIYNNTNENMYSKHPYKRDVIGNEQIISSITRQEVLDYYKEFYTPNNITTIIVGDMNSKDIIPKVIKAFDFKGRTNKENPVFESEKPLSQTKYVEDYSKINTGFLMFGYLCCSAKDTKTSIIFEVISMILGLGQSSRLYQNLIEKSESHIFNVISTEFSAMRDMSNFFIQANYKPEEKETAISLIQKEIEDLCKNGITEKELMKAKKKLKADFAENAETVSDIADTIGFYMTACNNLRYIEEYLNILNEITTDEVKKTANEYLTINKAVISTLMPLEYKN